VAVEAAGVADVARLLLCDRLVMGKRQIDLLQNPLGIHEGELIALRPADRLGIRE
jgi:hypothetical protein